MPHQLQALERLRRSDGKQLLHIGCGGGKTLTTLAYRKEIDAKKVLVVCPATLLSIWEDEAKKWFGWSVVKIKGNPKQRKEMYKTLEEGFYVIGYETLLKDKEFFLKQRFDLLVAEESHRIKNPTAKITKVISKIQATHRIALTGTAMPGGWKDIWSQVNFVQPGSLYSNFYQFRALHCIMPIPNIPMIRGYKDIETVKNKIKPFVFTVSKEEIDSALPLSTTQEVLVELSTPERKLYNQLKDELRLEISENEELSVLNKLGLLLRLRQLVNGSFVFGLEVPSSKLQVLKDLLDSIGDDEKVIIFTMFADSAKKLKEELDGSFLVCGDTPDKDSVVKNWKENGQILIGTKSLSEGWNLQESAFVVNYDLPYTNSEYTQRISRCLRSGQKRSVRIYNLIVSNSIDAHVQKILQNKKGMTDELVEWTKTDIDFLLSDT